MTRRVEMIEDETTITEITIQRDGRVYIFGTSRRVLDLLADLNPRSQKLKQLMGTVKRQETDRTATRRD